MVTLHRTAGYAVSAFGANRCVGPNQCCGRGETGAAGVSSRSSAAIRPAGEGSRLTRLAPVFGVIVALTAPFILSGCKRAPRPAAPAAVAASAPVAVAAAAPANPGAEAPARPGSAPDPKSAGTAELAALAALRTGLPPTSQPSGPRNFPYYMHVVAGHVVLWHDPPAEWARGKPDTVEKSIEPADWHKPCTAFRRVHRERLPLALRALPGTRLQLFSGKGLVCEARAGEVLMVAQALLNSYGHWERDLDPDFKLPKTRGEIARAIWDIDQDGKRRGHSLAVRAIPVAGTCEGAVWARIAQGPPPATAIAEPADPAWTARARAELPKTPQWQAWQETIQSYLADHGGATANRDDAATFSVWSFRPDLPLGRLLAVRAQVGNECSGGYHLWAVFLASGPPTAARLQLLLQTPLSTEDDWPTVAMDIDGDGRPEFLSREGLRSTAEQSDFMFLPWATSDDGCVGEDSSPAHPDPAGPGPSQ